MLPKKLIAAGIDPMIIKNTGDPYEGSIKVNMTFESAANSQNKDMAMVSKKMDTMVNIFCNKFFYLEFKVQIN